MTLINDACCGADDAVSAPAGEAHALVPKKRKGSFFSQTAGMAVGLLADARFTESSCRERGKALPSCTAHTSTRRLSRQESGSTLHIAKKAHVALLAAAINGHDRVVRTLIDAAPLLIASMHESVPSPRLSSSADVLDLLLERPHLDCDGGPTALWLAAKGGHREAIVLLTEAGCNSGKAVLARVNQEKAAWKEDSHLPQEKGHGVSQQVLMPAAAVAEFFGHGECASLLLQSASVQEDSSTWLRVSPLADLTTRPSATRRHGTQWLVSILAACIAVVLMLMRWYVSMDAV
jgi:hypothetical protein